MHATSYEQQFRTRVEELIGPTRRVPADKMPDGRWVVGLYRATPVWFGLRYGSGRLVGYWVAASLKERPIACTISRRRRSGDDTLPAVPTGDRAFDKQYRVCATPPEVVEAVLNEDTRRWMLMVLGEIAPHFETADGMLRMYCGLVEGRAAQDAPQQPVPALTALTRRVEVTLSLAERMASAFDQSYHALVRAQRRRVEVPAATNAGAGKPTGRRIRVVLTVLLVVLVLVVLVLAGVVLAGVVSRSPAPSWRAQPGRGVGRRPARGDAA